MRLSSRGSRMPIMPNRCRCTQSASVGKGHEAFLVMRHVRCQSGARPFHQALRVSLGSSRRLKSQCGSWSSADSNSFNVHLNIRNFLVESQDCQLRLWHHKGQNALSACQCWMSLGESL